MQSTRFHFVLLVLLCSAFDHVAGQLCTTHCGEYESITKFGNCQYCLSPTRILNCESFSFLTGYIEYESDCLYGCADDKCSGPTEIPRPKLPLLSNYSSCALVDEWDFSLYWSVDPDLGSSGLVDENVDAGTSDCPTGTDACRRWRFQSEPAAAPGLSFEHAERFFIWPDTSRENISRWETVTFRVRPDFKLWSEERSRVQVTFMLEKNDTEWFEAFPIDAPRAIWTDVFFSWRLNFWRRSRKRCAAGAQDGQCRPTGTCGSFLGSFDATEYDNSVVCASGESCCVGYEDDFSMPPPDHTLITSWAIKIISSDRFGDDDSVLLDNLQTCGLGPCENQCNPRFGSYCDAESRSCRCLNSYPWTLGPDGGCHSVATSADIDRVPCASCPTVEMSLLAPQPADGVESVCTVDWSSFDCLDPFDPFCSDGSIFAKKRQLAHLDVWKCACEEPGQHLVEVDGESSPKVIQCVESDCGGQCDPVSQLCSFNATSSSSECVCAPLHELSPDGSCQSTVCNPPCSSSSVCLSGGVCGCLPGWRQFTQNNTLSCFRCAEPCSGQFEECVPITQQDEIIVGSCRCKEGWERNDQSQCVPTCADTPCDDETEDCVMTVAAEGGMSSPACVCKSGLSRSAAGKCVEIVEQTEEETSTDDAAERGFLECKYPCGNRLRCDHSLGECVCLAQYETAGANCVDRCNDECVEADSEKCISADGSNFSCQCFFGLERSSEGAPCRPPMITTDDDDDDSDSLLATLDDFWTENWIYLLIAGSACVCLAAMLLICLLSFYFQRKKRRTRAGRRNHVRRYRSGTSSSNLSSHGSGRHLQRMGSRRTSHQKVRARSASETLPPIGGMQANINTPTVYQPMNSSTSASKYQPMPLTKKSPEAYSAGYVQAADPDPVAPYSNRGLQGAGGEYSQLELTKEAIYS